MTQGLALQWGSEIIYKSKTIYVHMYKGEKQRLFYFAPVRRRNKILNKNLFGSGKNIFSKSVKGWTSREVLSDICHPYYDIIKYLSENKIGVIDVQGRVSAHVSTV